MRNHPFRKFLLPLLLALSLMLPSLPALADSWQTTSGRWWYSFSNGSYARDQWILDGQWYHFDSEGWMQTGWQKIGGSRYYLGSDGAMRTGWQKIDGSWYWFDPSGAMVTGWRLIGGTWYFFNSSGVMQTGWLTDGGSKYYLDANGPMATGWRQIKSAWYYFDAGGAMAKGWRQVGGAWYFFNSSGVMQTGWLTDGGSKYYLDASGAMVAGWRQIGGAWYYFNRGGTMRTGWLEDAGSRYYFLDTGRMAQNQTLTIDGEPCTFLSDGQLQVMTTSGTSSVSPSAPLTRENILLFLDDVDPDGAYIIRNSSTSTLFSWFKGATTIGESLYNGGFSSMDTAVHEQCHDFTHSSAGYRYNKLLKLGSPAREQIYIGNGNHITVPLTDTFASTEMVDTVPESLRGNRFGTYVDAELVMSSVQHGAYGLLNEFTAYCWGFHNQIAVRNYVRENKIRETHDDGYVAYAEFRYYILHYMLYARDNYPAVYQEILNNSAFRQAFTKVDSLFRGFIETARGMSMLNSYYTKFYNSLMTEMQKPDYTEIANLLRP